MQPLGIRVATIRKELGFSQAELGRQTGLGQPRISRIEKGEFLASVDVIDKIAKALGRTGLDLSNGTDRGDHYFAQTRSPQELESKVQQERAFIVFIVWATYKRIFEMFDAIYGGLVGPQVVAEEAYMAMKARCEVLFPHLENISPGITTSLYFPDHIETGGEMDCVIDEWRIGEKDAVKKSLRLLTKLKIDHCASMSLELQDSITCMYQLDQADKMIAKVQKAQEDLERSFLRANRLA